MLLFSFSQRLFFFSSFLLFSFICFSSSLPSHSLFSPDDPPRFTCPGALYYYHYCGLSKVLLHFSSPLLLFSFISSIRLVSSLSLSSLCALFCGISCSLTVATTALPLPRLFRTAVSPPSTTLYSSDTLILYSPLTILLSNMNTQPLPYAGVSLGPPGA